MNAYSGKYGGSAVNAFYHWASQNDGFDQNDGSIYHEGFVNYYRFTMPDGEDPTCIDEWHETAIDHGEDTMRAEDIIALCRHTVGVILRESDDGFVTVETFGATEMFVNTWKNLVDEHTLNQCPICYGEAEEYGINADIMHESHCPKRRDDQSLALA